jgi:hypothetical protein
VSDQDIYCFLAKKLQYFDSKFSDFWRKYIFNEIITLVPGSSNSLRLLVHLPERLPPLESGVAHHRQEVDEDLLRVLRLHPGQLFKKIVRQKLKKADNVLKATTLYPGGIRSVVPTRPPRSPGHVLLSF